MAKLLFVVAIFLSFSICAQKFNVSGKVTDVVSGESLANASFRIAGLETGMQSNGYGYYSLSLMKGIYQIEISYLGYTKKIVRVDLLGNMKLDIQLNPVNQQLREIQIGERDQVDLSNIVLGKASIQMSQVESMGTMTGEADIFQALQYLPGIKAAVEGNTGLSVRGGSFDQTLILLDEAPVYNASHALGFFSVFNTDAIKSVDIYKGTIPAQFGGRLSSVVYLKMKEGNINKLNVSGGLGAIASKLTIEGPIQKEQSSFIVSGRYSYAGNTANLLGKTAQYLHIYPFRNFTENNDIRFYDLNAKINWKQKNGRDQFFLSGYAGKDWFKYYLFQQGTFMKWQNNTVSFRWNHIQKDNLFSNTAAYFSNYGYNYSLLMDRRDFEWKAGLQEVGLKNEWDYFIDHIASLKAGTSLTYTRYSPGSIKPRSDSSLTRPFDLERKHTLQVVVFVGYSKQFTKQLSACLGVRMVTYSLLGEGVAYQYSEDRKTVKDSTHYNGGRVINFRSGVEPRLSMNFTPDSNSVFSFAFNRSRQYAHLLSSSAVGLPTDIWLPSNRIVRPQSANLISLGYKYLFRHYAVSVEGYQKWMYGVIDLIDNANLFVNQYVDSQVRSGKGNARGLETMLEKKTGRVTGWVTYTLSKTDRTIEGVNAGKAYPARYDRRHSLSFVTTFHANKKIALSMDFQYNSGGAASFPIGAYEYMGATFNYYNSRNGYRLPAFHRLDLQAMFTKTRKKWERQFVIGIFNVYDKRNLFSAQVETDTFSQPYTLSRVSAISLYGVMPFFSYGFKF
ncbi:TonB-dependent receptor [Dyadobacter psychrophilus]|uniref:Outer membrane receptor proteins, mostly Fe transport n=1 Tax=Dyadobacter psychrophilus TaxID=651661 RepID=A0A1T5CIC1_9BACT|nr:carboxypeptidase-like regulatory domain-containing protein [Dyadobacter psychrophilus]SKB59184.1 Outer membrane receptor proteins, mostly Fe transport [Dyadobacter psychrophilus]